MHCARCASALASLEQMDFAGTAWHVEDLGIAVMRVRVRIGCKSTRTRALGGKFPGCFGNALGWTGVIFQKMSRQGYIELPEMFHL